MTHRRRGAVAALAAVLALSVSSCAHPVKPGPHGGTVTANAASTLIDTRTLTKLTGQAGWTPIDGSPDYTPAPCGQQVAVGGTDVSATWRVGGQAVQVHLVSYKNRALANAAAATAVTLSSRCATWTDRGSWVNTPIRLPDTSPALQVSRQVSSVGAGGSASYTWAQTLIDSRVVCLVTTTPGANAAGAVALMTELAPTIVTAQFSR